MRRAQVNQSKTTNDKSEMSPDKIKPKCAKSCHRRRKKPRPRKKGLPWRPLRRSPVNAEEALCASRHGSVAAQRAYMAVDQTSEANRMKALGFKIKKRTGEVKEKK